MKKHDFLIVPALLISMNSYGVTVGIKMLDNSTLINTSPIAKSVVRYFKNSDRQPPSICYAGIVVFGKRSENTNLLKDRLLQESAKIGGEMVIASEEELRTSEIISDDRSLSDKIPEQWNDRTLTAKVCKIQKAGLGVVFQKESNGDFQIKYVGKESAAGKAGLTEGAILLTINGRRFSLEALDSEVRVKNKGDTVDIEYFDLNKTKKSVSITLDSIPEM